MSVFLVLAALSVAKAGPSPAELASSMSLTTSTSLPFPTAALASPDAQNHLTTQWSLAKGRIQDGAENLAFVADPFDPTASLPVLQATYPAGSYSHDTGGAQFQNVWDSNANFQSMLISYELHFPNDFDWVKGGKLPGLRGGQNTSGCSGGAQPTGDDCFSTRLMWRQQASGEVYAYMPTPNDICSSKSLTCNDDGFGVSISRGSFVFIPGQWNRITLLVQLNNPGNIANGQLSLYFNDVMALQQTGLQLRSSTSLTANGLFFSTFFGGSDTSWATPKTTYTYYRNFTMWASDKPSTASGAEVKNGALPFLAPSPSSAIVIAISVALAGISFA